ncbi:hypothetical protein LUZ60_001404 [Juncus effusus]|nr:hypothetical protein LUZ60_001404 [Juncus effusus]
MFYHHPPPPAAGDPYPYSAVPALPSQPYSHPHNTHSYHLHPPTLNPIPINYSLPSPPRNPAQDELRTLFVAGLPEDVKPREIYNLFREFLGYESYSLRVNERTSQPYAFTVFSDRHSALSAMHALNGMRFDLERETPLHINLAKSNSRGKRTRPDDDVAYPSQQKPKYFKGEEPFGYGSNKYTPPGHATHNTTAFPRVSSLEPMPPANYQNQMIISNVGSQGTNPPCPTLFVTNLGLNCSENELIQVFQRWPGFLKVKIQTRRGSSVAFVDFTDEGSASAAMNNLQGTFLHSSAEGMKLEYAKSRMGLPGRRDRK